MRLVVVTNQYVTNVVEVSADWTSGDMRWQPPENSFGILSDIGKIGDRYVDGEFQSQEVPEPVSVPQVISDRQFYQQLAVLGLITQAEALAAVKTGDIPATLQGLIVSLPVEQRFSAEMLLSGAVQFQRNHPLTLIFGLAMGWTDEELDTLWIAASRL